MIQVVTKFLIFFYMISNLALAEDLMFKRILQLPNSSIKNWITRSPRLQKIKHIELSAFGNISQDLIPTVRAFEIKKNNELFKFLDKNYNKPKMVSSKVSLKFKIKDLTQEFSISGGALVLIDNPVLPQVRASTNVDISATSSYHFKLSKRINLEPKITYGKRDYQTFVLNTGDIIGKTSKLKFKNNNFKYFIDLSARFNFHKKGDWSLNFKSLPVSGYHPDDYWQIVLGYSSEDVLKDSAYGLTYDISFAPLFGGYYDLMRTVHFGLTLSFNDLISFSYFIQNKSSKGFNIDVDLLFLKIQLFRTNNYFDNFNNTNSEEYGLNFVLSF